MESDTERGVGSFGNDGEELSPMMTITSLNRGMDSIVAKAGTLSARENIKGITSFERKFKRAIDTTPFGCYPSMLLDVYEGTVGWSETDMRFVEKGWRRVQEQKASTRTSSSVLLAGIPPGYIVPIAKRSPPTTYTGRRHMPPTMIRPP